MYQKIIHQFTEGMYEGDAVSDHVLLIQEWLREMGYISRIFATKFESSFKGLVSPFQDYRTNSAERCFIYHHAVGSHMADWLSAVGLPQVLIYHNITPPEYYMSSNPALSAQLLKGRRQLQEMRARTVLALADSPYNEQELLDLGYENTAVLPIVLRETDYNLPIDQALAESLKAGGPLILFVGRVAPNKKQEDLITFLYYFRRLQPSARLILIGSLQNEEFVNWLGEYARSLGLNSDDVTFTGHVTRQELVTYYASADLYVSMSEHEGFGKPLIESMVHGLPILAYSSTAVPHTMGQAGVLFHEKNYDALVEAADIILRNEQLRERVIQRQNERVQDFMAPNVRRLWQNVMQQLDTKLK